MLFFSEKCFIICKYTGGFVNILLSTVFICCTSLSLKAQTGIKPVSQGILFASFKMTKDTLVLINTNHVEGSFKNIKTPPNNPILHYRFLNKNKVTLAEGAINHPLHFQSEYVKNETEMATREVNLSEAEFFIREHYVEGISYFEFTDSTNPTKKYLIKFPPENDR